MPVSSDAPSLLTPPRGRPRSRASNSPRNRNRPLADWIRLLVRIIALTAATRMEAAAPLPWETFPGGRRSPLRPVTSDAPAGFTELEPATLGIHWTNRLSAARYSTRQNLMNGAGVALADVDGDGWCDLYLCNKEGPSALFRNLGNWRFEDITDRAGVGATQLIATGAAFGDVNGDGRPDLFVTSFLGPDALYLNLGEGRFTNITATAGVASKGGTTSSAFSDVDGDGDLDLYVCHFGIEAILRDGAVITTRNVGGKPVVMGRFARRLRIVGDQMTEYGEPDVLFLNDGRGGFTPCPWNRFLDENGTPLAEAPPDFGLSVHIRDLDGNGTPDIYLCNDFQTPDRIWLGDGRGSFRAAPPTAFRNMSYASMGVDMADLTGSGHLDILAVEMLSREPSRHLAQRSPMDPTPRTPGDFLAREMVPRNTLQHARGDGTYADVAWYSGLAMSDWSWTPIFLDVDLDGFEDVVISNGHMHDVNDLDVNATRSSDPAKRAQETSQQVLLSYPTLNPPKAAWRNRGNLTFEDRSEAWNFRSTRIVHGMALADLDNDGDPDVVGNAWDHPPLVCRSESGAPRLAVRLHGGKGNPNGIGARVRVLNGAVARGEQEIRAGGRYLSSDQPQLTFAAGKSASMVIEVRWRSGAITRIPGATAGFLYEIEEPAPPAHPPEITAPHPTPPPGGQAPSLLSSVPVPPSLIHREAPFDDFSRQRLLPWRHSRLGPPLAVIRDSTPPLLLLGGARGDGIKALQLAPGGSATEAQAPDTGPLPDDATAMLAVELTPGRPSLLIGLSHHESGDPSQPAALRFDRVDGRWIRMTPLPPDPSVTGTIASGDFDSDGDPDIVVGGRFIPGRYPLPSGVRVFRNDAGTLVLDNLASAALRSLGLVTGLATADFNGDGRIDVAVACEWGPIQLFLGDGTSLRPAPQDPGLAAQPGLWQCLVAADFDGDGRMDLAAGNWGRNGYQMRSPDGPWELWYGPVDDGGHIGLVEAHIPPARGEPTPFRPRDVLATDLPWLKERFPRHRDFATSSVPSLLGDRRAGFRTLRATTLASTMFLNKPGGFVAQPLPAEAQFTPVFSMAPGDFDGDGRIDLACTQNLFAVRDDDDRLDAGCGLLLRNLGNGNWQALPPSISGVRILGEQRSAVAADLDGDGRPELAIGQNSGPVTLLRRQPSP